MTKTGGGLESVERWMNWAKQRRESMLIFEIKDIGIEQAQLEKERKEPEYTFMPNTQKPRLPFNYTLGEADIDQDPNKKGVDSYMQRMKRAKEMKDQKQLLEEQLFQREKKWKGQITQPKEPKLSAFISKKEREVD